MDLVKAIIWACAVIALLFAITALIAAVFPVLIFGLLVFIIWLIMKVTKDQDANTDPEG